jgi:hypothetical protein
MAAPCDALGDLVGVPRRLGSHHGGVARKAWCQCSWFSVGGGGDLCDAIHGEVL